MKFFYDCEFLEDGITIELISIGIAAEDGREFYGINRDFRWHRVACRRWWAPWSWAVKHEWLLDNVVPGLPKLHGDARLHYAGRGPLGVIDWLNSHFMSRNKLADKVRDFLLSDGEPELRAWYAAYDHVCLAQLWGPMMNLPEGVPMLTYDLKQECDRQGNPDLPEQASGEHNALADARHNLIRAKALGLVS